MLMCDGVNIYSNALKCQRKARTVSVVKLLGIKRALFTLRVNDHASTHFGKWLCFWVIHIIRSRPIVHST